MATRDTLRNLPAYPGEIILRMNADSSPSLLFEDRTNELEEIVKELDEQAVHALRTMLLVEYARCKKVPGDVVIKAFDGVVINSGSPNIATEKALKAIKDKTKA